MRAAQAVKSFFFTVQHLNTAKHLTDKVQRFCTTNLKPKHSKLTQ